MMVVLDTSAAVELVLQRPGASNVREALLKAESVLAPTLFVSETTNVFWKYYRSRALTLEQCERALDRALSLPDSFASDSDLYREAFAMACLTSRPAYDMFYVVLSRRNNAYLATMDTDLKTVAKSQSVRVL